MKTAQEIKNEFEQVFSEISSINGVSADSAIQVATVILQESGKNNRTQLMNASNNSNEKGSYSSNVPATEKQKYTLKKNGVSFPDNISKSEASKLLDSVLGKSGSNGKGRTQPAFSSFSF